MRVVAKLDGSKMPALLRLYIFYAPHRRMHRAVIQKYRDELIRAMKEAGIHLPFTTTIDLWLEFIDPTSPDYDNLLTSLYQALDGKALKHGAKPVLFSDDGIVGTIRHMGMQVNVP